MLHTCAFEVQHCLRGPVPTLKTALKINKIFHMGWFLQNQYFFINVLKGVTFGAEHAWETRLTRSSSVSAHAAHILTHWYTQSERVREKERGRFMDLRKAHTYSRKDMKIQWTQPIGSRSPVTVWHTEAVEYFYPKLISQKSHTQHHKRLIQWNLQWMSNCWVMHSYSNFK